MKKVYTFNQLRRKAKERAAEEVCKTESKEEQEWSVECREITNYVKGIIKEEYKLDCGDIYWDQDYGITIDLSSVTMTNDYLKNVLSKEEYALLEELKSLTDDYMEHRLFDSSYNSNGYYLLFNYSGFDEIEAMNFLMKYSEDEDVKVNYKLPLLMESKLSYEEYSDLDSHVSEIGEKLAQQITNKVDPLIKEMAKRLEKLIEERCDYLGSKEYYYESMEADCYPSENYLFNYQGEIILKDGEFVDWEYEGMYKSNVA